MRGRPRRSHTLRVPCVQSTAPLRKHLNPVQTKKRGHAISPMCANDRVCPSQGTPGAGCRPKRVAVWNSAVTTSQQAHHTKLTAHLPSLTADASNSYHPACGEHAAWTTAKQLEPSCCAPATPNQDAHMHPLQCCPGASFLAFNIPSFLPSFLPCIQTDKQQRTATPTTKMAASESPKARGQAACAHTHGLCPTRTSSQYTHAAARFGRSYAGQGCETTRVRDHTPYLCWPPFTLWILGG